MKTGDCASRHCAFSGSATIVAGDKPASAWFAIAHLEQKTGAWLKKPYTADELAEKVREVLRHPEE